MAKVQGKKTAAGARKSAATKVAARVKKAVSAVKKRVDSRKPPTKAKPAGKAGVKPAPKPAAKAAPKAAPKAAKKPAAKPAKAAAKVAKSAAKAVKTAVAKVTPKPAPKAAPKPVPAPKAAAAPKATPKPAPKAPAPKPAAPKAVAPKAVAPAAPAPAAAPKAAPVPEKRARRARLRIHSTGNAVAAWFAQPGEKPRPSSFIPAPPRAEAPSLVAAPPASSDRLIRPEDVVDQTVRTVPVRVDVEQGGGRIYIGVNPLEVTLRAGEGIEWDFRYLGGADVSVDEIIIELDKPSPFAAASYKSRRPGTARPHRQLSGAAQPAAAGKRTQYTIRAMNMFKTELATTRVFVNVL
ncbi:MAG TPA: hypothetical protein VF698_08175 [Thermoanaerobaculia bacterium]|jgi:hypothetical protein